MPKGKHFKGVEKAVEQKDKVVEKEVVKVQLANEPLTKKDFADSVRALKSKLSIEKGFLYLFVFLVSFVFLIVVILTLGDFFIPDVATMLRNAIRSII